MSDDKPQVGRITFDNGSDYKAPTTAHPYFVSKSGSLGKYRERIAELEAALRGLLEDNPLSYFGYSNPTCRYCGGNYLDIDGKLICEHEADCAYVKAQGLLGADDD